MNATTNTDSKPFGNNSAKQANIFSRMCDSVVDAFLFLGLGLFLILFRSNR